MVMTTFQTSDVIRLANAMSAQAQAQATGRVDELEAAFKVDAIIDEYRDEYGEQTADRIIAQALGLVA